MPGVIPKQLTKLLVLKILVIAKSKVIFVALTFAFYNECYRSNLTFLDQLSGKIIQKMRVVAGLWGCRRGRTNLNDDKKMPGPPQARTILKRMIVSSKTLFQDRSRTGDRLTL